ncbi:hypothetical protein ACHAWC_005604 [Mediolabrus comicus]
MQYCRLFDLLQGGGLLEEVAKFLAPPSKIMLALAVTPPKSPYETIMARSRSKTRSLTFMNTGADDWGTLDFGEFEKDLAAKLSDNDMSAILVHIDAVNKVKRLKLTNCIKITGIGLQPLRGSRIIEYIDLSLTRSGQNSRVYENPAISRSNVLPILDSIIAAEGCAVRKIEFPIKWRKEASTEFREFLERYNELWIARTENNSAICRCDECEENVLPVLEDDGDEDYNWVNAVGRDNFTCSACLNHFCADCSDEEYAPADYYLLFGCGGNCGKQFCVECSTRKHCDFCAPGCGHSYCTDCDVHIDHKCGNSACNANICDKCISKAKCTICEQLFCGDGYGCQAFIRPCDCCHEPVCSCGHNHPMSSNCSSDGCDNFCSARFCKRCSEQGKCSDCGKYYCSSCQSKRRHKLSNIECKECLRKIATGLVGENEQLRAEKEELRKEFERWHL